MPWRRTRRRDPCRVALPGEPYGYPQARRPPPRRAPCLPGAPRRGRRARGRAARARRGDSERAAARRAGAGPSPGPSACASRGPRPARWRRAAEGWAQTRAYHSRRPFSAERAQVFLATRCGISHNGTVNRQIKVALVAALAAGGCGWQLSNPFDHFRPTHLAPPARVVSVPPDDADHLSWATDEQYLVVVRKTCRTLDVYRFGDRIESFPAVFGLGGSGSKLYEGDLRTPTGLYMIVDKRSHPR